MEENMRHDEMMQVETLTPATEPVQTESAEAARESWPYAEHASLLSEWLGRLFWVFIALFVVNFIVQQIKAPAILSAVVSLVRGVAVGYILLQLAPVHKGYWTAGCFSVILSIVDAATSQLPDDALNLSILILIPALVASFVQMYFEYTTHAAVLAGLDEDFSGKWRRLWKWTIGLLAGLFGCILVMRLEPMFGLVLMLLVAIALVVTAILYVVYLRRMEQLFQTVAEREVPADETAL